MQQARRSPESNKAALESRPGVRSPAPEIVPLFATPLVIFDVPDASALNKELREVIAERARTHPSKHKSNMGGWQSSWDMDRWGGPAAIKLLAYARMSPIA